MLEQQLIYENFTNPLILNKSHHYHNIKTFRPVTNDTRKHTSAAKEIGFQVHLILDDVDIIWQSP